VPVIGLQCPGGEGSFATMALEASDVLIKSFDFVEGFFDEFPVFDKVILAVRMRAMSWDKVHSKTVRARMMQR